MPMVGSGPYVVTEFDAQPDHPDGAEPELPGPKPKFDELQWIKYGSDDAVERALTLGEVDVITEVQAATFDRLSKTKGIKTVKAPSPSFTELAFNLCSQGALPGREVQPGDPGQDRAPGDRLRRRPRAHQRDLHPQHGVHGPRILPIYYKDFYSEPEGDSTTRTTRTARARCSTPPAGSRATAASARRAGRSCRSTCYVRSESQENTQDARLVKEMAAEVGIEFKVQVVSVDKLTELTTRRSTASRRRTSTRSSGAGAATRTTRARCCQLITTSQIGGSSDAFYSNPEYDRLFDEQAGEYDLEKRKPIVKQMIEISQRTCRTSCSRSTRTCRRTGPTPSAASSCRARSRTATSTASRCATRRGRTSARRSRRRRARSSSGDDGGSNGLLFVVIALAAVVILLLVRAVPAAGAEDDRRRSRCERTLARREGARRLPDADLRPDLQLLPVPGHGRPDGAARAAAARHARGDPAAARLLRARQAAARPVRRLRRATPRGSTSASASGRAATCGTRSGTRCRGRCCSSAPARCSRRSSAPGSGSSPPREEAVAPTTRCSASACSRTRRPSTGSG